MQDIQKMLGLDTDTDMESNLRAATLASYQTKTLSPLIKEELKLKIQSSRLAAGKTELPKPVFKEPEKFQLTPAEEKRRIVRKEKNRIAALKCRGKKKTELEQVKTVEAELELKNNTLRNRVEDLESEKQKVLDNLRAYGINIPPSFSTPPSPIHKSNCTPTSPLPQSFYTPISPKPECFTPPPPRYIPQAGSPTNTWQRATPSPSPSPSPSSTYSHLSESSNVAPCCSDQYVIPVEQQIPFRRYSAETFNISCPSPNKQPRRYSADVFMFASASPNQLSSCDGYDRNDNINEQPHVVHGEEDVNISNFDFLSDDFLDFGNRAEVIPDVYVRAVSNDDLKVENATPPTKFLQLPDLPEFSGSWLHEDMPSDYALPDEQGKTQHSVCCNDSLVDTFEGYFVPLIVDEAMVPDGTPNTDNVTVTSNSFF